MDMNFFDKFWAGFDFGDLMWTIIKIVIVLVIFYILLKGGGRIIERIIQKNQDQPNRQQANTLATVLKSVWKYLLYFVLALIILSILDINITPILASAGVLGLAVSFGAQNLIKDIITGFFIIFDRYYSVGDYIKVGAGSGYVEEIGLRTTRLRDWGGEVYCVPNGQITAVANYSRGNQNTYMDVPVSYEFSIDSILEVVEEACRAMSSEFAQLTAGPAVLGLDKLEQNRIMVKIYFSSSLEDKFGLERNIRKRIKNALDNAGMSVPFYYKLTVDQGLNLVSKGE